MHVVIAIVHHDHLSDVSIILFSNVLCFKCCSCSPDLALVSCSRTSETEHLPTVHLAGTCSTSAALQPVSV